MYYVKQFICLAGILAILNSCQNEDLETNQLNNNDVSNETLEKLSKLGFDTVNIPVQKLLNGVRVEGDIYISYEMLNADSSVLNKQKYIPGRLVSCKRARNIRVFNALPSKSTAGRAVKTAIKRWNGIKGSFLKFNLVKKGKPYDIIIRDDNKFDQLSDKGQLGTTGDFPTNGEPTQFLAINRDVKLQINKGKRPNLSQWVNLITHELGHGIGLYHDNETRFGVRVVGGTNGKDKKSIMQQNGRDFLKLKGLSPGDRKAAKRMYGGKSDKNLCK